MRTFGIWASGLLAAVLAGAVLGAVAGGLLFAPRALPASAEIYEYVLVIAVAFAFICACLWTVELRG